MIDPCKNFVAAWRSVGPADGSATEDLFQKMDPVSGGNYMLRRDIRTAGIPGVWSVMILSAV